MKDYNDIIQQQIEKGIVEDVLTMNEASTDIHYLPHHAVLRSDKTTTKIRVVYNASAKSDGKLSLNDCLFVGPKFNQKILDILVRFRFYNVALTADMEKAFLMILISEQDRDALRFLWVHNIDEEQLRVRPLRFTRFVFGVASSPFLLNTTIRHHLNKFSNSHCDLVELLEESTYVDDIVTGADSDERACEIYHQSKEVFKQGGFNLRKFHTNAPLLQAKIDAAEESAKGKDDKTNHNLEDTYADTTLGRHHSVDLKVLGVPWNPQEDCLQFIFF